VHLAVGAVWRVTQVTALDYFAAISNFVTGRAAVRVS
jgi:hypothetical protein